jgi:hypothetical protein
VALVRLAGPTTLIQTTMQKEFGLSTDHIVGMQCDGLVVCGSGSYQVNWWRERHLCAFFGLMGVLKHFPDVEVMHRNAILPMNNLLFFQESNQTLFPQSVEDMSLVVKRMKQFPANECIAEFF